MKRTSFLLTIVITLIACQSAEKVADKTFQSPETVDEQPVEEEIPEEKHYVFVFPLIPVEESVIDQEDISLPLIRDDLLPLDPFLRLIELKKRFFLYNRLNDSPFTNNTVTSIKGDSNSYFLGTLRGGVYHYGDNDTLVREIIKPLDSLVNRSITGIEIVNDKVIIGAYTGLFSYDQKNDVLEQITPDGNDRSVLAFHKVEERLYWGTSGGSLYEYDGINSAQLCNFNSSVRSIGVFEDILLIATGQGLFSFNTNESDPDPDKLSNPINHTGIRINDILVLPDFIFILSDNGLWAFNHQWEIVDRLFENTVFLDSVESENYIYMGTHRSGIIIYDKMNNSYSQWGLDKGIPSLNVPAVGFAGKDAIFSIPDKGIVKINEDIQEKL